MRARTLARWLPGTGDRQSRTHRIYAAARRRRADPRPAAGRMVRPCADARGRSGARQYRARSSRPGTHFLGYAAEAGRQGPRRRHARVPARRVRFQELSARRTAERRFRHDGGAPVPVLDLASSVPQRELAQSKDTTIAAIAAKAEKEVAYHAQFCRRMGGAAGRRHRRKHAPHRGTRSNGCGGSPTRLFAMDDSGHRASGIGHRRGQGGPARAVGCARRRGACRGRHCNGPRRAAPSWAAARAGIPNISGTC